MSAVTMAVAGSCGKKSIDPDKILEDREMTYRTNPKSGEKISILGYGCMRWPTVRGEKEGEEIIDQEKVDRLVDYALEHGVNYFDTAPFYIQGLSEEATGKALSRHPRESYYIATKMSNFRDTSREGSIELYRQSFKRLRTDYIDYYLLHAVGGGDGMGLLNRRFLDNGILDFLIGEREKGNIRNLGFSYHGDVKVFDYLLSIHDRVKWDFVQIQLNYLDWQHAKEVDEANTNAEYLYNELVKRNIPAVIMEPLQGGNLVKVSDAIANRLKQRDPSASIASWAFRFAGSFPGVMCVLSGMTYMEHLQDNLITYSPLSPITEEEFAFLKEIADDMMEYKTIPCRNCKYCMPCPYGVDIPGILMHYNRCVNEGNIITDPADTEYKKARRAYLIGYDRSVPRLRQASHCVGCGECQTHCPQGIKIPQELHRIDKWVETLKQTI